MIEGSHLIDEFLHFFMYNAINHGVDVTCCSGYWLITEAIFFLLGHEWGKVCISFIDICVFAPGFECFVEKYGCIYIVVAEAKKLAVINYLISFSCKLFSVVELLKQVRYWYGWIPTCFHTIKIGYEVGGGDISVLRV